VIQGEPLCVDGVVSKALHFDGVDDFIKVINVDEINRLSNKLTFTGWFNAKTSTNSSYIPILTKGDSSLSTPYGVIYSKNDNVNLTAYARWTGENDQGSINQHISGNAGFEEEWVFFAWTFDSGLLNVYKNGEFASTVTTNFTKLKQDTLPLEIGRDVPGAIEMLNGTLDDIRIYNYALSDQEIQDLFALGSN
jgi:Concanavalin A-like lectin/glucanases superfamily